jgi:hypothetical protein
MEEGKKRKRLYVYVDESGQDTKGLIFIISAIVIEKDQELLMKVLEKIEGKTGKKNYKWNRAHYLYRRAYIEALVDCQSLQNTVFFTIFRDNKEYIQLTVSATAQAILKKANTDYKATIFVDGLKKQEVPVFTKGLREFGIKTRKVRGVKKEENNVYIRLADAICGLVRDAHEGNSWAKEALQKLQRKEIAKEL